MWDYSMHEYIWLFEILFPVSIACFIWETETFFALFDLFGEYSLWPNWFLKVLSVSEEYVSSQVSSITFLSYVASFFKPASISGLSDLLSNAAIHLFNLMLAQKGVATWSKVCATEQVGKWEKKERQAQTK